MVYNDSLKFVVSLQSMGENWLPVLSDSDNGFTLMNKVALFPTSQINYMDSLQPLPQDWLNIIKQMSLHNQESS